MRMSFNHIRHSLSLKLSTLIMVCVALVFVISLSVLFVFSRRMVHDEVVVLATQVRQNMALRVRGILDEVETATHNIQPLVMRHLQPDSLLAFSRRVVELNPNINGCSISMEPNFFPRYGRYFSAYTVWSNNTLITEREDDYEYFNMPWYKTARQREENCWIDPFDDSNPGQLAAEGMIASYCCPLFSSDNTLLGVISTDLSLQWLSDTLSAETPYPDSYFVMLGENGQYLVHPDTTKLFNKTVFTDVTPDTQADLISLGHEMITGNEGYMKVKKEGKSCMVFYQRVPNTKWSIALVCPERKVMSGYQRLVYILVPLLIGGLLLLLFFCHWAVGYFLRPLRQLTLQSKNIAEGQLGEPMPHSNREDEVGCLQNSFATMQESLNTYICQLQEANDEANRRNEELTAANKLVEEAGRKKTTFIQNVTHQIRTPLNIIMGFAQVLRDTASMLPAGDVNDILETMGHNAGTLNRMVLMIYDCSDSALSEEMQSRRNEDVACNDVARECIAQTNQHFPGLPVAFETSLPDTFSIHSNQLYLMRSLREFLYNAAKYSDGQHIALFVEKTETAVRFICQDTGPGIAEEFRDKIYEPFIKENDLSEGLGLGLPLAKRHVVTLGGDLILDADYHDGCRFIMELPIT